MITIRQATVEDIPLIMKFIDEHWRKGDALATNREFFEWSFVRNGKVTIIIGIDDNAKIYGMHAYMPYTDDEKPDIFLTIWKTIKCDNPVLGLDIDKYLFANTPCRYRVTAGLREKSIRILNLYNRNVAPMDHYYRLNDLQSYNIAVVCDKIIPNVGNSSGNISELFNIDEFKRVISEEALKASFCRKDYNYIERRYYNHPIYDYKLWRIDNGGSSGTVFVTRDERVNGHVACKIVDYYGNPNELAGATASIDKMMQDKNYEYMDIYSFGFPTEVLERAGFMRINSDSRNIIPNYFQPFLQENVDIMLRVPTNSKTWLFRGDGDQDRPISL